MRTQIRRKLVGATAIVTATALIVGVVSYLDRLLPQSSWAWLIVVEVVAVGGMLGVSWICDEADAYFERRAKKPTNEVGAIEAQRNGQPHRNGQVIESWQFDPLDELRAVVYRAQVPGVRPAPSRWSATRAWRGQ